MINRDNNFCKVRGKIKAYLGSIHAVLYIEIITRFRNNTKLQFNIRKMSLGIMHFILFTTSWHV